MLITPTITRLDGRPLPGKTRAITLPAGTGPTIRLTMLDGAADPLDLTPYVNPAPPAVPNDPVAQLVVSEAVAGPAASRVVLPAAVAVPAAGEVQAAIDPARLATPGIYEAAFGVYDVTGYPAAVNSFWLYLEPNLFAPQAAGSPGPPRIDEVRRRMRDSDPAESRLLTGTLWDDADVVAALLEAVQAWNQALPPVAPLTTSCFPRQLRFGWIEGACAQLLYTAAEWYGRNYLQVQGAGGVAVADMDRGDVLLKSADRRWRAYLDWVRQQKVAINASRGYGRLGSPYRVISWGSILNP